jgi:hypothetical protein
MLAVKTVFAAHYVASHRAAGESKFGLVETGFGERYRFIGSSEHGQKNGRYLPFLVWGESLLRGFDHVGPVVRRWCSSAPGREQAAGSQNAGKWEERDVRKPVHRSGLLIKMVGWMDGDRNGNASAWSAGQAG